MSCIPKSGGCERRATDILVAHINSTEGTHYVHEACLDQIDRTNPQPECLYVNSDDNRSLVVERKSVLWPESYAYHHSKHHDLFDEIDCNLTGVEFGNLYVLYTPPLLPESKKQVSELGRYLASEIRSRHKSVRENEVIKLKQFGCVFEFCIWPLEYRSYDSADCGLCYEWLESNEDLLSCGIDHLHNEMKVQVDKVYHACIRKFSGYFHARRIVMLEPHGEVRFKNAEWWNELFRKFTPPEAIDEIWTSSNSRNDFGEEEWVVERVFRVGVGVEGPVII